MFIYNSPVRGDRDIEKPVPQNSLAEKLVIGEEYTIMARVFGLQEGKEAEAPTKMTLIALYPNIARFRRKAGYTESFTYWDLARRLQRG
ncbi:MAG: hypothetical protein LUC83_10035 [Clostridiales bacterium]|nr:hypothetical protein [Clostridiales bacterium]